MMNNLNRPFQYSNTEAGYFHSHFHKRARIAKAQFKIIQKIYGFIHVLILFRRDRDRIHFRFDSIEAV